MKVLVATDRIGRLSPAEASDVVATAFAARGADVAVAPVATGGADLAEAIARFAPQAHVARPATLAELPDAVGTGAEYLDLTALPLPSLPELEALPLIDLAVTPVAVLAAQYATLPLTGLTGVLAELGRAGEPDLAEVVAQENRALAWLRRLELTDAPGCGAHGGIGAWLLRCGVRSATGIEVMSEGYDLRRLAGLADLVVTGADTLDFHTRGGEVVRAVTGIAGEALSPVVVVCGRNFVSARELRHTGVEEAHAVRSGLVDTPVTAQELEALAARVATTWHW
ncbi:MAG: glycerate kinase [Propionibacteriaceae bacterium]|nr:glycerate kinase [Propionibacteriaceae bacterium]